MKKIFTKSIVVVSLIVFLSLPSKAQVTELWGTNFRGGDDYIGRIVRIDATGTTVSQAHGFPATYAGASPNFTTLREYNGYLYGLAPQAGKYNGGILFRYSPVTGISEKLFDFNNTSGLSPIGSLLLYNNRFYGITNFGGSANIGTIYEFDPVTNIFTKKLDLTEAVGGFSNNTFAEFNNKLYATTTSNGLNGFGAIIEYDPATNTCIPKINLANDAITGRVCYTGMTLFNNKFYGAMQFGGTDGLIFEWDPVTNIYTKKIDLDQSTGRNFTGRFTSNGTVLYASPNQGPGQFGQGCIVEYNPTSNVLTTKVSFDFSTGAGSFSDLTFFNNKYYGCNTVGGANSRGAWFEWDPATNSISKRVYGSLAVGEQPTGNLTPYNGKLYGTFLGGGVFGRGTLAEWDVASNILTKKFEFSANTGAYISTKLLAHNGKVYGVTYAGGTNNKGVLFSKDLTTGVYTVLHNFPATAFGNDYNAYSALSVFNNKIYGVSNAASPAYIFEWDVATATFSQKYTLTAAGGTLITGKFLLHSNNRFYGIARSGGASGFGSVFSWDPVTNVFANLVSFGSYRASNGGFTAFGSKFYVPASTGGNANNDGSVIEFDPATNAFTFPVNFSSGVGSNPSGEFELLNGKLYTTCMNGGVNQYGSLVEYVPATASLINKFNFNNFNPASQPGANPNGMLLAYNNELYGFAIQGGVYNQGTTFKYNPVSGVFTKLEDHLSGGSQTQQGNGFITVQSSIVLPVTMNYFAAVKISKNTALLQWQTSSENNNKGFVIERSNDGVVFEKIGWVAGAGYGSVTRNYSFTDHSPLQGENFYRLQQEDFDGRKYTSEYKLLRFDQLTSSVSIYPNPFSKQLYIINPSAGAGVLILSNSVGAVMAQQKLSAGKNIIELQNLAAGFYYYKIVHGNGTVETGKLIRQ